MFLKFLKISKISLFWKFWKKSWLCLASWALFILKLYKAFQTAVQIAIVIKVMIKFWAKFQFQIPLQFYWKSWNFWTGDGQTFWQVPPSFQPSHFDYYFAFSWLRFKHTEYKGALTYPIKFSPKRIYCRNNCIKYKQFPATFFNHFIQPSSATIAKLKSLHGALRVQPPP